MRTLENVKFYSEKEFFSRVICILLRILNVSFTDCSAKTGYL